MTRCSDTTFDTNITVTADVLFDIRFERDGERGGYAVTWRQLPEVAAHGDTFIRARAAARRAIKDALEKRAAAGERFPKRRPVPAVAKVRRAIST